MLADFSVRNPSRMRVFKSFPPRPRLGEQNPAFAALMGTRQAFRCVDRYSSLCCTNKILILVKIARGARSRKERGGRTSRCRDIA